MRSIARSQQPRTDWKQVFAMGAIFISSIIGTSISFAEEAASPTQHQPDSALSNHEVTGVTKEGDDQILRDAIKHFVNAYLLSSEVLRVEHRNAVYAPFVSYFGIPMMTREAIAKDQLAYTRRWPERVYNLKDDSLIVKSKTTDKYIYVEFDYIFNVHSLTRKASGVAHAHLTLEFTGNGIQVVQEDGYVIRRIK